MPLDCVAEPGEGLARLGMETAQSDQLSQLKTAYKEAKRKHEADPSNKQLARAYKEQKSLYKRMQSAAAGGADAVPSTPQSSGSPRAPQGSPAAAIAEGDAGFPASSRDGLRARSMEPEPAGLAVRVSASAPRQDAVEEGVPQPSKYTCVENTWIHSGFGVRSKRVGMLKIGEVIDAIDQRLTEDGILRVQFCKGWVSMRTGTGVVCLEPGGTAAAEPEPAPEPIGDGAFQPQLDSPGDTAAAEPEPATEPIGDDAFQPQLDGLPLFLIVSKLALGGDPQVAEYTGYADADAAWQSGNRLDAMCMYSITPKPIDLTASVRTSFVGSDCTPVPGFEYTPLLAISPRESLEAAARKRVQWYDVIRSRLQAGWKRPDRSHGFDDGRRLIGHTVYVEEKGEGTVASFKSEQHQIQFDHSGLQSVGLERNGNNQTPVRSE